jgi:hypothetical protein
MGMEMKEDYTPQLDLSAYTPANREKRLAEAGAALAAYYAADPGVQAATREYEKEAAELSTAKASLATIQHQYPPLSPVRHAANMRVQAAQQKVADAERAYREAKQAAAARRLHDMQHKAGGEPAHERERRLDQAEERAARERYLAAFTEAGGSEKTFLEQWPMLWARLKEERGATRQEASVEANRAELLRTSGSRYSF